MKTLLILRHAKSSWSDPGLRDHDRPLNSRGRRDAPRMGRLISDRDLVPQRIVSSTAVRARTTAALAAAEFEEEVGIETTHRLYGAYPDVYIDVVEERGGEAERVMVVGHNPGITSLVTRLTGAVEYMPTAALAVVELDIDDWRELGRAEEGRLVAFWRPKALPPG
ncbi:SixA phosphatase family protein [Candidatus Palauibacter sp.]|uniref:SixA phosphatase family protein n=1 Tax=Candidatus Palauibacter sp. TaxID=3101350 RepID=UPI003B01FC86